MFTEGSWLKTLHTHLSVNTKIEKSLQRFEKLKHFAKMVKI